MRGARPLNSVRAVLNLIGRTAMTTLNVRLSFALLSALAAIASASPRASAADQYITHSVKVSFADLNLDTSQGAAALYERIQSAARKVCSPESGERPIERYRDWRACREAAVGNAVAKVNRPLLSALHSSKTAGPQVASTLQPRR
jgi:UrcA family protein